jgi:hypothetical protein
MVKLLSDGVSTQNYSTTKLLLSVLKITLYLQTNFISDYVCVSRLADGLQNLQ